MMKKHITTFLCSVLILLAAPLQALVEPIWSTGVAVPGEQVILYLIDKDCKNDPFEIAKPSLSNASIKQIPYQLASNPLATDGSIIEFYPLVIVPDAPGTIDLGTIEVTYKSGRKESVNIPPLHVAATSDITWFNSPTRYGALWYTAQKNPYMHESVEANIKIFLPQDLSIASLPQFNAVGSKLSPFDLAVSGVVAMMHNKIKPYSTAYANREEWRTADFKGTITTYSKEKSVITGSINVSEQRGLFFSATANLALPTFEISPLPLPPGAPAGFNNIVGTFELTSSSDAQSLSMNEVVDVQLTVRGTGDLNALPTPAPLDEEAWKLMPAKGNPINDINGKCTGMVYHQLLRPTKEVDAIPSFGFSYFNPESQQYEVARSKPIPLIWKKSDVASNGLQMMNQHAEPPPAGSIPVAEMTDIYGALPEEIDTTYTQIPAWLYAILYLPAIILLSRMGILAWMRHHANHKQSREQEKELRELAKLTDGLLFLKNAGAFAESKLDSDALQEPAIQELLRRRDEEAFRPQAQTQLNEQERKNIIQSLRIVLSQSAKKAKNIVPMLLLACLLTSNSSSQASSISELDTQAVKAYQGGQFSESIDRCQEALGKIHGDIQDLGQTDASRLYYHLANAYYRLGDEGKAALAYARALRINPHFKEAAANLAFIQRKQGAITSPRNIQEDIFTYLSPYQLSVASIISSAALLFVIALLLYSKKQKSQIGLKLALAFCALSCILCVINWIYYTNTTQLNINRLAANQVAYVIKPSQVRTAADEKGSVVTALPSSTALIILAHRPSWDYVECLNGTRGWVANKDIEGLQP